MILPPRPDDTVVAIRDGHPLRWGEFRARVGGIAGRLEDERGRPVVPWCKDSWDFATRLFGALAAGANVILPGTKSAACGLILDEAFNDEGGEPWDGALDPLMIVGFHTSGSTGEAKRVERSLMQLAAETQAISSLWGRSPAWSQVISTVSHQHVYGLAFALLWPLSLSRPFSSRPLDHWEDVMATLPLDALLVTSPAHLTRMGGLSPLPPDRCPAMVLSAGAPLPENAAQDARRLLGVPVTEIYGSTETGALAHRLRSGNDPAWTPLPGYDVTRTDQGLIRLDSPAARAELADRIEILDSGVFRLLGRVDRIAKVEGKRVSLEQVEHALKALPQVEDAACLMVDDTLAAVIALSPQGHAERQRLGDFRLGRALNRSLASRLEPAERPKRRRFVDGLPLAHMGKRRESDLARLFTPPRLPLILDLGRNQDASVTLTLNIPEDLYWLQGHFPGHPILPGVVQLDWAAHFARTHLGVPLPSLREFQIKFKAVIGPGETITLTLRHQEAKGRVTFAYGRNGTECASGTLYQ